MSFRSCTVLVVGSAFASATVVLLAVAAFGSALGIPNGRDRFDVAAAKPAAFATAHSGLKVRYVESGVGTVQPGADDGFEMTCPKKIPHPVAGYGGPVDDATVGKIVLSDTFHRSGRDWDVGMKNLTDQPQKFFVGIVCVR
jgi:hypothetical protein